MTKVNKTPSDIAEENDVDLTDFSDVKEYGAFTITDAVLPIKNSDLKLRQGYKYEEDASKPYIVAAATKEIITNVYIDLVNCLKGPLNIVVIPSHTRTGEQPVAGRYSVNHDQFRQVIYKYEDGLLNDGCVSISAISTNTKEQVRLDAHKLLVVASQTRKRFADALITNDVFPLGGIQFIYEDKHFHQTSEELERKCEKLIQEITI